MNELVRTPKKDLSGREKFKRISFISFNLYKKNSERNSKLFREIMKSPYKGVKLQSLLKIIVNFLPRQVLNTFFRTPLDFSHIPIDLKDFELQGEVFNSGFEQALFLLKSEKYGDKILKVDFYQSFSGSTTEEVRNFAIQSNLTQNMIKKEFGYIDGVLVPETFYFTASSPFNSKETQMCLVDCVSSEIPFFDLYNSNNLEQIKRYIEEDKNFAISLLRFCESLSRLVTLGIFLDIAGRENLVLAVINGKIKICLLDCQTQLDKTKRKDYSIWLNRLTELAKISI